MSHNVRHINARPGQHIYVHRHDHRHRRCKNVYHHHIYHLAESAQPENDSFFERYGGTCLWIIGLIVLAVIIF